MRTRFQNTSGLSSPVVSLVAVALLLATGCAGSAPPETRPVSGDAPELASSAPHASATLAAGLRPGDAVKVQIWREPDLSGEFQVTQRGTVVFPLLGEREVAGRSVEELERRLVADYREYLENPSVSITVLRRISVLGEVRQPGLYPVDPTMTLTEALAMAGGVSPSGNKNDIRLIRSGQVIRRSLDAATRLEATQIESGDQIMVGQRSWLSRNIWVVTTSIGVATSIFIAAVVR